MRNMSFALTTPQVLDQSKDVTRRLGWLKLKAGDLIQPVKKCMGLRPGEKIDKLGGAVRVLSTRREPLALMITDPDYGFREIRREGFAEHPVHGWPTEFVSMFCATHKGCTSDTVVTRIEFSYDLLEGWEAMATAPKDGTPVELLLRHLNWHYATGADKDQWQQIVDARWIDFNHGGWTWHGIAGEPVVWRPAT